MHVQNVGMINFNFKQNIQYRRCYDLYSLVEDYSKLSHEEIKYLESNDFSKQKLQTLHEQLFKKFSELIIGKIGYHKIQLRDEGFMFEIGKICRLWVNICYRSTIKNPNRNLEFIGEDISIEGVSKEIDKIKKECQEIRKHPKHGTEEEFSHSKTLDALFTPEFKVEPQKTDKGYLTTIINNKTGKPEKVYINIRDGKDPMVLLSKDIDNKYPIESYIGRDDSVEEISLGCIEFEKNDNDLVGYVVGEGKYEREYNGVGYRLIQASIEYSLQKNADIVIDCIPEDIPFYTKAGFRVNTEKDELVTKEDWRFWDKLSDECECFDIPWEQFQAALIERSRDGISGYGKRETLETFYRLLYQKNKHYSSLFYNVNYNLELTPEAKQEWLERIKSQPIFPETQDLIEKGTI